MSHSQYALLDDVWLSMVRMRALRSGGKRVLLQASWQADHWQAQRYVREHADSKKP